MNKEEIIVMLFLIKNCRMNALSQSVDIVKQLLFRQRSLSFHFFSYSHKIESAVLTSFITTVL